MSGLRKLHRSAARAGFHVRYGRSRMVRRLQELERTQWLAPEALQQLQWEKLLALVRHAYERVPFYRRAMDEAGLTPGTLRTQEDYARLPLLSKADLNAHMEDLVADGFPRSRLIKTSSGGSTGMPVHLYHDSDFVSCYRAVKLRNFAWAGWRPGDGWARIWGSAFDIAPHQRLGQRVLDWAMRARFLLAFDLSEESMARFARTLQRFKPDIIEAYATAMYVFARYVSANGIRGISPRGIITSAESLSEHERDFIEEAFGCRVFNRYGCRELGDVAQECAEGTMHINLESVYVEVLRDGRPAAPGETGELVLTPLDLYSAPLLRYRVEDAGALGQGTCPCGRGLPSLASLEGRIQGMIALPSGGFVSGVFFPHLFKDFDIVRYQVLQESLDEIDIRLVPGPGLTDEQRQFLLRTIHDYTKGELNVNFSTVDEIEPSPSGKHLFTVSKVPLDIARDGVAGTVSRGRRQT